MSARKWSCKGANASSGDMAPTNWSGARVDAEATAGSGRQASGQSPSPLALDDLSNLINKCHKLQLSSQGETTSPGPANNEAPELVEGERNFKLKPYQQFLTRCISPGVRKASAASELLQAKQAAQLDAGADKRRNLAEPNLVKNLNNSSPRRHSTYMLPILLNSRTPKPGDELSDDDDDDDTNDDADQDGSDSSGAHSAFGTIRSGTGESSPRRAAPPEALADDSATDNEDDLDKDLLMVAERDFKRATKTSLIWRQANIPNSASSPSSLSTPTNERPSTCKCCGPKEGQQQLTSNGNSISDATAPFQSRDAQARHAPSLLASSGASQADWNLKLLGKRKRLGSNPLDRFREGGSGKVRSQPGASSTGPSSRKSSSSGEGFSKRHSIINIFSHYNHSHNQHQQQPGPLARRLSSGPKWTNSNCSNNQRGQLDQSAREQYEPLIPESGFKIVVMGTSGSGKTSIIQRFMYNSFSWRHLPTVEDTYFIEFPHMKNIINISISDTSGTYQFPAMKKLAINSGDAFILVYSVDNIQSFNDLEQLRETILSEREQAYLEQVESTADLSIASNSSSSGVASSFNSNTSSFLNGSSIRQNHLQPSDNSGSSAQAAHQSPQMSPARHWSLASLFHQNNSNSSVTPTPANPNPFSQHYSQASSMASSSASQCSSTDNSRRSSLSAAEAALRTRRTRHPPIVVVANKHDLPDEQHLVNSDEIEALAVIDWNNGFVRASAALDWNINEIFQQVLKQARQPPTLAEAIVSKRRKSLPPKLPQNCHITQ